MWHSFDHFDQAVSSPCVWAHDSGCIHNLHKAPQVVELLLLVHHFNILWLRLDKLLILLSNVHIISPNLCVEDCKKPQSNIYKYSCEPLFPYSNSRQRPHSLIRHAIGKRQREYVTGWSVCSLLTLCYSTSHICISYVYHQEVKMHRIEYTLFVLSMHIYGYPHLWWIIFQTMCYKDYSLSISRLRMCRIHSVNWIHVCK